MRRLLAILLLATFGLPVVASALALGQDPEANLPICCRRNGAHHCMMGDAEQDSTHAHIGMRCPSFPQQSTVAPNLTLIEFITAQPLVRLPLTTLSASAPTETRRSTIRENSHPKRGPPATFLAA